jgi:hypothetical protein
MILLKEIIIHGNLNAKRQEKKYGSMLVEKKAELNSKRSENYHRKKDEREAASTIIE